MYLDSQLVFSNPQALTVTAPSTSVIDLAGLGVGNTITNIIGNAAVWGEDIGVGDVPGTPKLYVTVGTALTGGTSLNVQFQGAPDNGSGSPGTYVTYAESGAVLAAALVANTVIFKIDVPEIQPEGGPLPRFLRLNYLIVGTFGAGNIAFAGIIRDRQDWVAKFYPNNFAVA
jgi:hypothetical protein